MWCLQPDNTSENWIQDTFLRLHDCIFSVEHFWVVFAGWLWEGYVNIVGPVTWVHKIYRLRNPKTHFNYFIFYSCSLHFQLPTLSDNLSFIYFYIMGHIWFQDSHSLVHSWLQADHNLDHIRFLFRFFSRIFLMHKSSQKFFTTRGSKNFLPKTINVLLFSYDVRRRDIMANGY